MPELVHEFTYQVDLEPPVAVGTTPPGHLSAPAVLMALRLAAHRGATE